MTNKDPLMLHPYMIKNPKFFRDMFNMPVENVHPIIAFEGETNYYFMTLRSYKSRYDKQISMYKKIILKGQGDHYQMSKDSVINNDIIYKVEKSLLQKNVFSRNKNKVRIINDIEIEQILRDLSTRMISRPPKIALVEITFDKNKSTQSQLIYAENSVLKQYKNAARKRLNKYLSLKDKFNSLYSKNQLSDNFIHKPNMNKSEIFFEINQLKSQILKNFYKLQSQKKYLGFFSVTIKNLEKKISLGELKDTNRK
ncbi:Mbov_0400 family ICE element protein [Mycoplasmopsis agassizii]|nr:hypothetical protein [Mycoplasmopsis agassizii]SMC20045.1 hypothetical protein SAMN02745179_00997 [Mycoplasmopsis agassizii]